MPQLRRAALLAMSLCAGAGFEDQGFALQVSFEIADVMTAELQTGSFHVAYSRDTILHIKDKRALFNRYATSLWITECATPSRVATVIRPRRRQSAPSAEAARGVIPV
jgi:hypothetical protein